MKILYIHYFIGCTWYGAIVGSNIEENQVETELILYEAELSFAHADVLMEWMIDVATSRTSFSNPWAGITSLLSLLDERHHQDTLATVLLLLRKGDEKISACVASDVRRRRKH